MSLLYSSCNKWIHAFGQKDIGNAGPKSQVSGVNLDRRTFTEQQSKSLSAAFFKLFESEYQDPDRIVRLENIQLKDHETSLA